jgi:hypothetical protein
VAHLMKPPWNNMAVTMPITMVARQVHHPLHHLVHHPSDPPTAVFSWSGTAFSWLVSTKEPETGIAARAVSKRRPNFTRGETPRADSAMPNSRSSI